MRLKTSEITDMAVAHYSLARCETFPPAGERNDHGRSSRDASPSRPHESVRAPLGSLLLGLAELLESGQHVLRHDGSLEQHLVQLRLEQGHHLHDDQRLRSD